MRSNGLWLPVMVASLAMSGVGLVGSTASQATTTTTCTDIHVLGARGTGQSFDDVGGWYSDVIGRTVDQFKAQVLQRAPSMAGHIFDIALTGDEYKASDGWNFDALGVNTGFVDAGLQLPADYHKSVSGAKDAGRAHVNSVINNSGACVLFTGYSQGAQVAADLMEEFIGSHPNKVVGGMFYGDPYFRGDSKYSSSGRWDNPFNAGQHGGLGQRPEFSAAISGRVISTCHGKELVCQGVTWKTKILYKEILGVQIPYGTVLVPDVEVAAHSTYTRPASNPANRGLDMTEEAADSARRIVSKMGFVRPSAPAYSGPVDIVFAVDTTGSMSGEIKSAKSYVRSFPATNDSSLPDVRYGLIAYRDVGDAYVTRVKQQPTSDRADFARAVDGLYAGGGGDTPEAVFAAAHTAMGLDTRSSARKIVIFVGDAPAHDPDRLTGATLSDITLEAIRKGFILSAVDYSAGLGSTFPEMAAATGGMVIDPYAEAAAATLGRAAARDGHSPTQSNTNAQRRDAAPALSALDTTNPLLEAVLKSVAQPQARLAIGLPAIVGKPTTVNASGSSDPIGYISKYEWDLDNDGTYDRTTDYPTVEYAFPTVGDHTVAVRVTNDVGEIGVASASVTVTEVPLNYPDSIPSPPAAPSAVASDASITLTINPASDGVKAGAFTVSDAATGQVLATVAADESGLPVSKVVFKDLPNGVAYTYSVIAQNILGYSAPSAASAPVVPAAPVPPPVVPAAPEPPPVVPAAPEPPPVVPAAPEPPPAVDTRAASGTAVSASANKIKLGENVTLTAAVTGAAAGNIEFSDNGHVLGSAPIKNGKATLVTKKLFGGTQTVTAKFAGDAAFKPSAGTVTVIVKDKTKPKLTLRTPKKTAPAAKPSTSWVVKDKGGVRSVLVATKVGKAKWSAPVTAAPTATPLALSPVAKGTKLCVKATALDWAGNRSKGETRCTNAK